MAWSVVKTLRLAILALAVLFAANVGEPASSQPVDLQLVLAVDTSGSVSEARFELRSRLRGGIPQPAAAQGDGRARASDGVTMVQRITWRCRSSGAGC
jgi:hypothetical protein